MYNTISMYSVLYIYIYIHFHLPKLFPLFFFFLFRFVSFFFFFNRLNQVNKMNFNFRSFIFLALCCNIQMFERDEQITFTKIYNNMKKKKLYNMYNRDYYIGTVVFFFLSRFCVGILCR